MAAYDYLCQTCDQVVEIRASFSEKAAGLNPQCPSCKSEDLRRLFTTVSIGARSSGAPIGPMPSSGGGGGCCGGGCCG